MDSIKTLDSKLIYGRYTDPDFFHSTREDFDTYWEWPDDYGSGYHGAIKIRPGLILRVGNYQIMEPVEFTYEVEHNYIDFEYGIKGLSFQRVYQERDKKDYIYSQGKYSLQYLPGFEGIAKFKSSCFIQAVSMLVSIDLIRSFMEGSYDLLPERLKNIVANEKILRPFFVSAKTPEKINSIINEIFFCSYKDPLRRVFLEGKALELFSTTMNEIMFKKKIETEQKKIKPSDMEIIHHVKNILEKDLQNPPSLFELAKEAGISHPRLNLFFKQTFGKTVFEYLREERLKKAKLLLNDGKLNVTEVANEVGYTNLSHFAKAFRNHFGLNPGDLLKISSLKYY